MNRTNSITAMAMAITVMVGAGCTTVVRDQAPVPVYLVGCSSNMQSPLPVHGSTLPALDFFVTLIFDPAVYGACVVGRWVKPAPASVVSHGLYHSGRGTYTVGLPLPGDGKKPSIEIIQPTLLPTDYVTFWPRYDGDSPQTGIVVFGVGVSSDPMEPMGSHLPGWEAATALNSNPLMTNQVGQNLAILLRQETVTVDGRPAIFGVYSTMANYYLSDGDREPAYLLTYFMRTPTGNAALVLLWEGDCPACQYGSESEIRKLDPNIGRFVDSFRLTEPASK